MRTVIGETTEWDEKGFRDFCSKSGIDKSIIQANLEMVRYCEAFLKK
jgi:hypothetical protein